jgi:hypothetical protein
MKKSINPRREIDVVEAEYEEISNTKEIIIYSPFTAKLIIADIIVGIIGILCFTYDYVAYGFILCLLWFGLRYYEVYQWERAKK